jgi:hypothetical protein
LLFTIKELRVKIQSPNLIISENRKEIVKMIKCLSCGTENLDSSQYCDECGTALKADNRKTDAPNFQPQFTEMPNIQQASVTSVGIPMFVPENGSEMINSSSDNPLPKEVHATLLIERGSSVGTEFRLTSEESYIGRWDADNGIFPDVDLDTQDPEAKVSRRHARIIRENNRYAVEDLGSTNGTFINRGRRLIPGNRQQLSDGDEIIVGKTFLRFHIV